METAVIKAKRTFNSYQSDPLNLLRSIQTGEYDKIFVQYHRCVWSEYGNNGNDEDDESGCKGDGNEDDNPWYMGRTQCYRANVAYSLYGVLTGDKNPNDACQKRYYINTFISNNGIEDFGNALGLNNDGDATSQCVLVEEDDDGEEDDNNDDNEDDGGSEGNYFQHNVELYPNAHSYTTYCANGRFVTAQFTGKFCTGKGELELMDTLSDLNNELSEVDCVLAYSADESYEENDSDNDNDNNSGDENDNNERQLEEEEEENSSDENRDEDNEGLRDLLAYSSTCSILEYPNGCPDPFGVKKRFDLNPTTSNGLVKQMHLIDWLTLTMFVLGMLLLMFSYLKDRESGNVDKSKRRGFGFRRNRSKSPSKARGSGGTNNDNNNSDAAYVISEQPKKRKKKGFFRRLFSRKK
jgi:hypothetical protein